MKTYLKLLVNLVFLGASFGFVGPFLVSAADTMLVLGGLFYLFVIVPTVLYFFNKKFPLFAPEVTAPTTTEDVK